MRFLQCLVVLSCAATWPVSAATIADLHWLAGCWAGGGGDRRVEEQWMAPAGGTMLGMSRTVAGGKTRAWEFMRIEEGEGKLVFIARPSGQEGASFPSVAGGDGRVVFENPGHDFPQRVIYQRGADGGLLGRIEGESDGKPLSVDFPMDLAPCPGVEP
jgi:Domain of unknown function (DUF6265)